MSAKQPLNKIKTETEQYKGEKSVNSLLDEFQKNQYEQEFDRLIDILLSIISSEPPNKPSKKKDSFLSLIFTSISLRFVILFVVIFPILATIILFAENKALVLAMFFAQAIVIIFAFASSIKDIIKDIKKFVLFVKLSAKDKSKLIFEPIKNNFATEQLLVKDLHNNFSLEKLKLYEIELEKQIRKTQANEKVIHSLLLLAPLFTTFIVVFAYGDGLVNIINNTSLSVLKITSIALYSSVIGVVNSLYFRDKIDKLNVCLSCLKKAQVKQDTQETQIEKSDKKESFMSQIKKIKIDAPADFSTNYEKYM